MVVKKVTVEINLTAWSLFVIGLALRLYRLDHPGGVVFDELHYGRHISMYARGVFFFDSQPPLGKQLVAVSSWLAGWNGNLGNITGIGSPYDSSVPVKALRIIPALCGSLLVPVVYHVILTLGLSEKAAVLTSLFYLMENSLLTQSRFVLMDSIQLFFSWSGLLFTLNAIRTESLPNLLISSALLSLGVCVQFCGFYPLILATLLVLRWIWTRLPDSKIPSSRLWIESIVVILSFTIIPIIVYTSVFYVHLSWLTKAGPHDNILTSAFQASLEGGLASITKGQPLEVVHGSQITLRHSHGRACWLHSHPEVYPVKYADGRGSSHQQQVTCYSFKDVNNWWIVKKPAYEDIVVHEPLERIKDGDVVQIVHGMSGRLLNSHDVAAPMSPHNQEVSCYIDYNISMPSQNLWKVHLLNPQDTGGNWHTIRSFVQLIHLNSSQVLKMSGRQLPDWGFNQHEVVTDRVLGQEDAVWNVEEHRYTRLSEEKDRQRDLISAEFVPLEPTKLNFWSKMKELQYKMIFGGNDKIEGHVYENQNPLEWIFLTQGIAYWIDSGSNSQIHLIGNYALWMVSLVGTGIMTGLLILLLLRRRRLVCDISEEQWTNLVNILTFCLTGYALHFFPYFLMERSLFLYNYLPCLLFLHIMLATLFDFAEVMVTEKINKEKHQLTMVVVEAFKWTVVLLCLCNFYLFLPLSYGSGNLSAGDVERLRWKNTWLLIVHKK